MLEFDLIARMIESLSMDRFRVLGSAASAVVAVLAVAHVRRSDVLLFHVRTELKGELFE